MISVLVLLIVLAAVSSCYLPRGPWGILWGPRPMKMEVVALGPLHDWVPEWVLCIEENCELVDVLGNRVTNLEVIRGGKVTIWNKSGEVAYINFGEAFAPRGVVRLNPEFGVWRRVAMEAPESGFEVEVACGELEESILTGYALPDTIITPPPNP